MTKSKRRKQRVSAGNRATNRSAAHVRFHKQISVHHIPHHNTYTHEETSRIWYRTSDYDLMDNENYSIVDMMTTDMMENDNDADISNCYNDDCDSSCSINNLYCTRGLEDLLPGNANRRNERRNKLWDAVMDEQFFQWEMGIENPKALAMISRHISRHPCLKIARLRGQLDEQAALKIHASSLHDTLQDHRMQTTMKKLRQNCTMRKAKTNTRNNRRRLKSEEDCTKKKKGRENHAKTNTHFSNNRRSDPLNADNGSPLHVPNYDCMKWPMTEAPSENKLPITSRSPPTSKKVRKIN